MAMEQKLSKSKRKTSPTTSWYRYGFVDDVEGQLEYFSFQALQGSITWPPKGDEMKPGDGIYWFREDPNRTIKKDIEWACARFISKNNGDLPTAIIVNPDEEDDFVEALADFEPPLELKVKKQIQKKHFWIGTEKKNGNKHTN